MKSLHSSTIEILLAYLSLAVIWFYSSPWWFCHTRLCLSFFDASGYIIRFYFKSFPSSFFSQYLNSLFGFIPSQFQFFVFNTHPSQSKSFLPNFIKATLQMAVLQVSWNCSIGCLDLLFCIICLVSQSYLNHLIQH